MTRTLLAFPSRITSSARRSVRHHRFIPIRATYTLAFPPPPSPGNRYDYQSSERARTDCQLFPAARKSLDPWNRRNEKKSNSSRVSAAPRDYLASSTRMRGTAANVANISRSSGERIECVSHAGTRFHHRDSIRRRFFSFFEWKFLDFGKRRVSFSRFKAPRFAFFQGKLLGFRKKRIEFYFSNAIPCDTDRDNVFFLAI